MKQPQTVPLAMTRMPITAVSLNRAPLYVRVSECLSEVVEVGSSPVEGTFRWLDNDRIRSQAREPPDGSARPRLGRHASLLGPGDPRHDVDVGPRVRDVLVRDQLGHPDLQQPPELAGRAGRVDELARLGAELRRDLDRAHAARLDRLR